MATLTETLHPGGFIASVSEVGKFAFEEGTLASGEDLAPGTVLMLSGAELIEYDGSTDATAIGVLFSVGDASAAAIQVTYLARGPAEVRSADLTYPSGELSAITTDLAALSPPIIVRS